MFLAYLLYVIDSLLSSGLVDGSKLCFLGLVGVQLEGRVLHWSVWAPGPCGCLGGVGFRDIVVDSAKGVLAPTCVSENCSHPESLTANVLRLSDGFPGRKSTTGTETDMIDSYIHIYKYTYECGSKLNTGGYAGFGPCFHLPGFQFGTVF